MNNNIVELMENKTNIIEKNVLKNWETPIMRDEELGKTLSGGTLNTVEAYNYSPS